MPYLIVEEPDHLPVWRVGFAPEPWAWPGWEWATNGRFTGRWDDIDGIFRTIYAGSTLLACLLEVLAGLRPDPALLDVLDDITVDPDDGDAHPTARAGTVDPAWLGPRTAAAAQLTGRFCHITSSETISILHADFVDQARRLGLHDFDAAALKDTRARPLTQTVASHLYTATTLDGVRFASRHGDDLELWAVFERPSDEATSRCLTNLEETPFTRDHPELAAAFAILGLRWTDEPPVVPPTEQELFAARTPDQPLPIEEVSIAEVMAKHTVNGSPDPSTPLGAAMIWWQGLADPHEYRNALEVMSYDPVVWGDYTQAAEAIADLAILSGVEPAAGRDDVAYIKFIDYAGAEAGRIFEAFPIHDYWVVTLIRPEVDEDGWWRVWGLSHAYFPSVEEVTGN